MKNKICEKKLGYNMKKVISYHAIKICCDKLSQIPKFVELIETNKNIVQRLREKKFSNEKLRHVFPLS